MSGLLTAELLRFRSRRFIQLLLVLALALFVLVVGIVSTEHSKASPEQLVQAEANRQEVVVEQERFRQECIEANPGAQDGVPAELACGSPLTAEDLPLEQFIEDPPFLLASALPEGAAGIAVMTAALAFLIGATFIGAEWSSRSIVALLFWVPRRRTVMAAKVAVLALMMALLAVVAQALWTAAAFLLAATRGSTERDAGFWGEVLGVQSRGVLLAVLMGLFGFALANLIRNTGAALGVGFVYFAIVENVIRGLRPTWQRGLISDNVAALVLNGGHTIYLPVTSSDPGFAEFSQREVVLSNLHGGLVLSVVVGLLVVAGIVAFVRRDLH